MLRKLIRPARRTPSAAPAVAPPDDVADPLPRAIGAPAAPPSPEQLRAARRYVRNGTPYLGGLTAEEPSVASMLMDIHGQLLGLRANDAAFVRAQDLVSQKRVALDTCQSGLQAAIARGNGITHTAVGPDAHRWAASLHARDQLHHLEHDLATATATYEQAADLLINQLAAEAARGVAAINTWIGCVNAARSDEGLPPLAPLSRDAIEKVVADATRPIDLGQDRQAIDG